MCPGSAEWWLDHKGTKNPESPGMQQYKVTAKHTLRSAKHEPSSGVWGHVPQESFGKVTLFCSNFDYN